MKTADRSKTVPCPATNMGSEYTDAKSYLKQPVRALRVKQSDPTFHGSNESEFAPPEPGDDEPARPARG